MRSSGRLNRRCYLQTRADPPFVGDDDEGAHRPLQVVGRARGGPDQERSGPFRVWLSP